MEVRSVNLNGIRTRVGDTLLVLYCIPRIRPFRDFLIVAYTPNTIPIQQKKWYWKRKRRSRRRKRRRERRRKRKRKRKRAHV